MAQTTLLCLATLLIALLACRPRQPEPEPQPAVSAPSASTPPGPSGPPAPSRPPPVARTAPDTWLDFTSSNGRFSVRVPVKPTIDVPSMPTLTGPKKTHVYTAEGKSGAIYQIAYSDLPTEPVDAAAAEKALLDAQHGAAGHLGGAVLEQRELRVHGFPAREFSMQMTSQGTRLRYWGRMVLARTRLYQLQVISPDDRPSDVKRARFFQSFAIRSAE